MLDRHRRQEHLPPRGNTYLIPLRTSPRRRQTLPSQALLLLFLTGLTTTSPARAQSDRPSPEPQQAETFLSGESALSQQMHTLLAAPAIARAHWGVAVSTLDGHSLLAMNDGRLFHPASNAKLFTTAAAMALLGPDATVATRIESRGLLRNGTLTGDLALVGAGDANLAVDDVPYHPPIHHQPGSLPVVPAEALPPPPPLRALEVMADTIVAAGVRTITGDVVGDDTRFAWEPYPEDWAQDDLLWGYGAPVSALSLHDNQIALHIHPGTAPGSPASAEFEPGMPPWFTLDTTGLTTAPAKAGTHFEIGRVPGSPRALRLWGIVALPAGNALDIPDDVEQIAIPDPALFAAEALRGMLQARGVTINGVARAEHRLPLATVSLREQARQPLLTQVPASPGPVAQATADQARVDRQTLATAVSPALLDDETATNKLSQNLHAELLLSRLGERFGFREGENPASQNALLNPAPTLATDPGSRAQGIRVIRSIFPLAGIDPDDVVLVDGSGLSTHDLVTPRAIVRLLTWASSQPWFSGWRSTLPVSGVDGSLANRFSKPPLTGHISAKTGTLGEARALSGYLTCASGRTVAFSILVDNHSPGSTADRDTTDQILTALYAAL